MREAQKGRGAGRRLPETEASASISGPLAPDQEALVCKAPTQSVLASLVTVATGSVLVTVQQRLGTGYSGGHVRAPSAQEFSTLRDIRGWEGPLLIAETPTGHALGHN